MRAVFRAVVRVVEYRADAVALTERVIGPRAAGATVFGSDGAVVEIPLVNRRETLVSRTHVERYGIVGTNVGTRVRVDVNHHAVLLDEFDDDDVRPSFIHRRTRVVTGQTATDVAEVEQVGGVEDGVGGTGDIAAVDRPLVARVRTAVFDFGYEAGFDTAAFRYHRGVAHGKAFTVNRNLRRYGVVNVNRYGVVRNADGCIISMGIDAQRIARCGVGLYEPIHHLGLLAGVQVGPEAGIDGRRRKGKVRPRSRVVTLTNQCVGTDIEVGFHPDFDGGRIETAVRVQGLNLIGGLFPYGDVDIGRRFVGVQPTVSHYIRTARLELYGFGSASEQLGGRNRRLRYIDGRSQFGRIRRIGSARIGAGHRTANHVAHRKRRYPQRVARLTGKFYAIVEPLVGRHHIRVVGVNHYGIRRTHTRGVNRTQRGFNIERLAEQYLGHGGGIGFAEVVMVDNGTVVNRYADGIAGNDARITVYGRRLPPGFAIVAFFPLNDVEVRRFGQIERIGYRVANRILGRFEQAGRGLAVEAQQDFVARAVAYTVVGHAANVGRIVGKRRQRIILAVVRRGQCRPVVARLGVLVFPTVGVLVGHAAKYVQTRKVGAVVFLTAHLNDIRRDAVVVNRRVRHYVNRFGIFTRTYAVGDERTEIERVFGRNLGRSTRIALHVGPTVKVAGIGVDFPFYLGTTVIREVERQFGIGAEVGPRLNRGLTANRRQIHLNRMFARNGLVGFVISKRKAVNRGLDRLYDNLQAGFATRRQRIRITADNLPQVGVATATALRNGLQYRVVTQTDGRFFRQLRAGNGQFAARYDDEHIVAAEATVGVGYAQCHRGGLEERARDNRRGDVGKCQLVAQPFGRRPGNVVRFYRLTDPATAQNLRAAATDCHIRTRIHFGYGQAVDRYGLRNGVARHDAVFGRGNLRVNAVAAFIGQLAHVERRTVVARKGRAVDIPTVNRRVARVFARDLQRQFFIAAERVVIVDIDKTGRMDTVEDTGAYMRGGRGFATVLVGYHHRVNGFFHVVGRNRLGGFARGPQVSQIFARSFGREFEVAHTYAQLFRHRDFGQRANRYLNAVVSVRQTAALQISVVRVFARFEYRRGKVIARSAIHRREVRLHAVVNERFASRVATPNRFHVAQRIGRLAGAEFKLTVVVAEGRIRKQDGRMQRQVGRVEHGLIRNGVEAPVGDKDAVARAVEAQMVGNRHFEFRRGDAAVGTRIGQVVPAVERRVISLPLVA